MTDWDEAEKRVEKAHELYERGKMEEALAELQAAIAINPFNAGWYFNLGITYDAMERPEEAVVAYRHAIDMEPEDVEVLTALGCDLNRLGKFPEAIATFQRIESLDSSHEAAYCYRIISYSELGDHDKAEEMFFLARQYKETCPLCLYNIGNSLYARGNYDKALWCWQQVVELEPDHGQVHARIADALWAKGQLGEAKTHFVEELRNNPGDIDVMLDLGELLVEMGHHPAAAEKFRQVLELSPDEATAQFHLGEISMHDNDPTFALEQFRTVLRIDRAFPGAHLRIAQIYHGQRDAAEAVFHANCELAQQQNEEQVLSELGALFMDMGQLGSAEIAFNRVLTADPANIAARHDLAVTMLMVGRLDEGIEHARHVLRIQPKFMLAMHNLALAYLQKRDFTRAHYWLHEALDIDPNDAQLARLRTRLRLAKFFHTLRTLPAKLLTRRS